MRIDYDRITATLIPSAIIREIDKANENMKQYNEYQTFYKGGRVDKVRLVDFIDWQRLVGIDYIKAKVKSVAYLLHKNKQKLKYRHK